MGRRAVRSRRRQEDGIVAKFGDALRGYAHLVVKRDGFVCRYCGLDGKVWPN
jgi:hypothetical protein